MRHDIRLLYLVHTPLCPVPVSVRLPTDSCRQGCFFCCKTSWLGKPQYALKNSLTVDDFQRLWKKIIINNDFRFVWPQRKILNALKQKRVLRFVREELFESSLSEITKLVLLGCYYQDYGLLVKTSSVNVVNYISALREIKHCIVFSVTDLLENYKEKVKAINTLAYEGIKVTLSLKPIFEYNEKTEYILSSVNRKILGVEVGWLYGNPSLIPVRYLNRENFKIVHCEKQYKLAHRKKVVENIQRACRARGIPVRFYFSSHFFNSGACCFVDKTL